MESAVQDLLYHIMLLAIYNLWQGRPLYLLTWDWIFGSWQQLNYDKHEVESTCGLWESEPICVLANFPLDRVRTKVAVGELQQGVSGLDV